MQERRYAHLVGTLPFSDEEAAMRRALELMGEQLRTLPDGEIGRKTARHPHGERLGWIQWVVERFDDNPAFELVKPGRYESRLGRWADLTSAARYRVTVPSRKLAEHVNFGFLDYFEQSYPTFDRLREERGRNGLNFQVGIPGAAALSLFALGPVQGLRLRGLFEDRLAHECNRMYERAGQDVVFQLEVPVELGLYLRAPRLAKPLALQLAAGWVASLVEKLHPNARTGLHLCLGDLDHRSLTQLDSLWPLVTFTNAVAKRWPREHPLDFVHMPLAMASLPPSLEPSFYDALRYLELPDETRFVAGFVHAGRDPEQHDRLLAIVQERLDRPVDISHACGLGQGDPVESESLMREAARLANTPPEPTA
jgi:hypothetical protein